MIQFPKLVYLVVQTALLAEDKQNFAKVVLQVLNYNRVRESVWEIVAQAANLS